MGDSLGDTQMKEFISITDELLQSYVQFTRPEVVLVEHVEEAPPEVEVEHPILQECRDLVFKLRAFMESDAGGDYALGVETGMQRAADMVENLIKRFENGDDLER